MTSAESAEAITLILSAYPTQRQRMSQDDVRGMYAAYAAGLSDLPFDAARAGITKLVKTSKWMPTIAEIRAATVTARDGRAREGAEGWQDILQAVGRYGGNRTPGVDFEFSDPITARVVRAFGWREICQSENQIADRARVIELYEQLAEHDAIDRYSGASTTSVTNVLPGGTRPIQVSIERTTDGPKPISLVLQKMIDEETTPGNEGGSLRRKT